MSVRVAINGFGRIGRVFLRAAVEREAPIDIVAVNDVGDPTGMAMLLRHDSVYGPYPGRVAERDGELMAGDVTIPIFREPDPRDLPWRELEVDVVLESTGHFRKREQAQLHLDAGAAVVVVSAPATDPDVTLVLGVNDEQYRPEEHRIISNASCTTNCVAPVASVLNDAFGYRGRLHDHHPRLHERPKRARPAAQGSAARAGSRHQPHSHFDRGRQGDRARHSRTRGETRRRLRAGPGPNRIARRSRCHTSPGRRRSKR